MALSLHITGNLMKAAVDALSLVRKDGAGAATVIYDPVWENATIEQKGKLRGALLEFVGGAYGAVIATDPISADGKKLTLSDGKGQSKNLTANGASGLNAIISGVYLDVFRTHEGST